MEHHSNIVPIQMLCERTGAKLNVIPMDSQGNLIMKEFDKFLSEKTKLVFVSHVSNALGTVNPISYIIDKSHGVGAKVLIDASQSVTHKQIDVQKLGCDFLVFSGHKIMGPTGVGVLYGKSELLNDMPPFLSGGEMINTVNMDKSTWNDVPWKFEAGTPNIAQVIGLGAAIDYIEKIGIENIHQYEQELLKYGLDILSQDENITLYGNPTIRGAVIPFNVKNIHPHDLAKFLDTDGICIRAGHHCAQPIMNKLKITATARASFYIYNTRNDIEKLVEGIKKTADIFN